MRLPLESARADRGRAAPAAGRRCRRRRVLIIEDNVDAADSLREALELGEHEVEVAYNGPDGLAQGARASGPRSCCATSACPGWTATRSPAPSGPTTRSTDARLVALSGYALPEDLQRAAEAGFERHLAKPPSLREARGAAGGVAAAALRPRPAEVRGPGG